MKLVRMVCCVMVGLFGVVACATSQQPNSELEQTAWGTPAIDGIWNFSTLTPLERPVEFGDRAVLTAQEAKDLLDKILQSIPPRTLLLGVCLS